MIFKFKKPHWLIGGFSAIDQGRGLKVLVSLMLGAVGLIGCQTTSENTAKSNQYRTADEARPLVDDKYSLTADRKKLDEMRAQVPEEKKKENDELAFILGLMSEVKKSPSDIRSAFDTVVRKKRELFDKDIKKEREVFTTSERKKRDEFLKQLQKDRDTFMKGGHSREEKTEFFKEIDAKRTEHFSIERDKRNDFESDVRERRKNFEDYLKGKRDDFNSEMKAYQKKYDDNKKEKERLEKEKQKSQFGSSAGTAGSAANVGSQMNGRVQPFLSSEDDSLEEELKEARRRAGQWLKSGE